MKPFSDEELAEMDRRDARAKECSGLPFSTPINYDRFRATIAARDEQIERLKKLIRDIDDWLVHQDNEYEENDLKERVAAALGQEEK